MTDLSHLDKNYFIDEKVYNCPFCKRNNVFYAIKDSFEFNWTETKKCYGYIIECFSCNKHSMHLTFKRIKISVLGNGYRRFDFKRDVDIDSKFFYSVPISHFALDNRIPQIIRELITEADGCLKMNYLTGASACIRKAIYEMTVIEKAEGEDYEKRIKFLKKNHPEVDPSHFDILAHIKDMTSDKVHEQSWDKWNSKALRLIIETLRTILDEMYVSPKVKAEKKKAIEGLLEDLRKDKKGLKEVFDEVPESKSK